MNYTINKVLLTFISIFYFLVLSYPPIKSKLADFGLIILTGTIFFVFIQFYSFYETLFAFIVSSPFLGYGFYLFGITVSMTEVLLLSLIIKSIINIRIFPVNTFFDSIRAKSLLIFLLIAYFSLIVAPKDISLVKNFAIIKLTTSIVFLLIALNYKRDITYFGNLLNGFKYFGISALVIIIYENMLGSNTGNILRTNSVNTVVLYFSISILVISFQEKNNIKYLSWSLILFLIFFSILSETRTGLIYSFLCIIFNTMLLDKRRSFNKLIAFPLIFFGLFIFLIFIYYFISQINVDRESSNISRINVLTFYSDIIRSYILTGIGYGNWISAFSIQDSEAFTTTFSENLGSTSLNPHNTFIRIFLDTGLIGLVSFVFLLYQLYISSNIYFIKVSNSSIFPRVLFCLFFITFFLSDVVDSAFFWSFFLISEKSNYTSV